MPENDPVHVREQYKCEDNLRARKALYDEVSSENAPDVLREQIKCFAPLYILEVGGGEGELAEWMTNELGAEVAFVDQSERMVELARARGIAAQVADAQALPFGAGSFDAVVAAWMLYHVPDLDLGISELARVLRPGGKLFAVTNSIEHLAELRELVHYSQELLEVFNRENGAAWLGRYFSDVERVDVDMRVTVRDRLKLVAYQQSMSVPSDPVPEDLPLPFVTFARPTIFIATR